MVGDFDKCEIGDFIVYENNHPSFDWQNDVYMILKKKENGWIENIRMSTIFLKNFHQEGFLTTSCVNIESSNCALIKKSELFHKFNNPIY